MTSIVRRPQPGNRIRFGCGAMHCDCDALRSDFVGTGTWTYTYIYIYMYIYVYICIFISEIGSVVDPNREIGFGSVAVRCVAIAMRCNAIALRCDAMRCEAVCACEERRFCWLVFQVGSVVPGRAGPVVSCHPSLPRSNEKQ